MSHAGQIHAANGNTCQEARQQQIKARGFKIQGAGRHADHLNGADAGQQRHGPRQNGRAVKHVFCAGFDQSLAGDVIRIHGKPGSGDQQVGTGIQNLSGRLQ